MILNSFKISSLIVKLLISFGLRFKLRKIEILKLETTVHFSASFSLKTV